MVEADLVVVAASTELIRRFPGNSNWDSKPSTFVSSGDDITISEDEVLALSVCNLYAELGAGSDGELKYDHSASDTSSENYLNMIQSLKIDVQDVIGSIMFDDGTCCGDDSDSSPVSVCDIVDSNDATSVMFSDVPSSEILAHYWCIIRGNPK